MLRLLRKTKGQSTSEYLIVLGLVVGAAMAMQVYLKRGIQGLQKEATDELGAKLSAQQYEPYYLESSFTTQSDSTVSTTHKIGGGVDRGIASETDRTGFQTYSY